MFGGNQKYFGTGSAPVSKEVLDFFKVSYRQLPPGGDLHPDSRGLRPHRNNRRHVRDDRRREDQRPRRLREKKLRVQARRRARHGLHQRGPRREGGASPPRRDLHAGPLRVRRVLQGRYALFHHFRAENPGSHRRRRLVPQRRHRARDAQQRAQDHRPQKEHF